MTLLPALLLSLSFSLSLGACGGKDDEDGGAGDGGAEDGGVEGEDGDGDGFDSVATGGQDCDDFDASVNPDATEVCNDGQDDDCDGLADDADDSLDTSTASTWFSDGDSDGFGADGAGTLACADPGGSVAKDGDCNDADPAVNPAATEICNDGVDDDCNDLADDDDAGLDLTSATSWYSDTDRDGYGSGTGTLSCLQPPDSSDVGGDCDDADDSIHPGAAELCDGVDQDCDPETTDDGQITIGSTNYDSLQAAVDAAAASDTIMVCAGTYVEDITAKRSVRLLGVEGAASTIVTGSGAASVFTIGGDLDLTGLTITGGSGFAGGAIDGYSAKGGAVQLTECVLTGNSADFGGAVLSYYDALTLVDTEVHGNSATTSGGGIYATDLVLEGTMVYDNQATYGGGVYIETTGLQADADSWIYSNSADSESGIGGGIAASLGAELVLDGTMVSDNDAAYGGGAFVEDQSILDGGEYTGNSATITGGGVVLGFDDAAGFDFESWGNTAAYGGGLGVWGTGTLLSGAELYANDATYGGGIIFTAEAEADIEDISVDGNTADYGGGLFFESDNIVVLSEAAIDNNIAEEQGGGMYVYTGLVELSGGSVTGNYAGDVGGGAALSGTSLSVSRSDWGEDTLDNSPDDVYVQDNASSYSDLGSPATFDCEDTGCF